MKDLGVYPKNSACRSLFQVLLESASLSYVNAFLPSAYVIIPMFGFDQSFWKCCSVSISSVIRLVRLYIFDGLWAFTFQSCIHVQRKQLDDVHTSPSKKSATYMSTCKLTFRAGCASFASSRLEGPTLWSDRSTWFVTSGKAKDTQIQVFSNSRQVTHALDDQCRRAYLPRQEA